MKIKKILAIMAVGLMLGACSGDSASKVASKISNGEALTEADYTEMIDYCGKFAEKAQELQDQLNVLSPTSEEAAKLTDELASLSQKYKYAVVFNNQISSSTKEEVGEGNVAKISEYAPLTWFVAPEWADVDTTSNVVGSIVDMPSSDSTNVIAVGDGEAVSSQQ